jgi:RNA polymerase sigma factor (sigma-70 family)
MEDCDEETLWRRIGSGDRAAFDDLYQRYEQDVLRFCQALLHDEDEAREAANSTWTAIWETREAAERDISLRPWLFRIAHDRAIDIRRRRRPNDELDLELVALDDTEADSELHERFATLRADLMSLPQRQRAALALRAMSGLSHEEIGAVLGITPAAAKQTVYEARRALIDAEGGRMLACDVVRRAISAGDGRVLRGRRIRAHLRSCAACREFAEGVRKQGRELKLLIPFPAVAALIHRLTPGSRVAAGRPADGVGAWESLSALGANAGGPLAAKVAVGAAVLVAGAGGGQVVSHAGGQRAEPNAEVVARRPHREAEARKIAAPTRNRPAPAAGAPARPAQRARGAQQAPANKAPAPATRNIRSTSQARPVAAVPPGQAKEAKPGAAVPPGQAKKAQPAAAVAPGQARKQQPAATVPPGQAKKQQPAAALPPGQAKKILPPTPAHHAGAPPDPPSALGGAAGKEEKHIDVPSGSPKADP